MPITIWSQNLSLIKLSEITGYNPSYLSRLYKNATSENLYEYISKARIDRAKQLLEDTDTNINDISVKVGFGNTHMFQPFFQKTDRDVSAGISYFCAFWVNKSAECKK